MKWISKEKIGKEILSIREKKKKWKHLQQIYNISKKKSKKNYLFRKVHLNIKKLCSKKSFFVIFYNIPIR